MNTRAMFAAATLSIAATALANEEPARPAQIEVCFVLDTTGSMGGLIEGAKAKIWAIANQMIAAKPTPKLKIALIGYRDRSDEYVTRPFDLSEDIDAVYANLKAFAAGGGGDGPESVNQALHEAVNRIHWSPDKNVLKIVFLVGDFPPHMDYPDDVKYQQTCQAAVKADLIINTIQCGTEATATPAWQEIARLAEGRYVAIGQTGDVQIIATPMDEELARLNVEIGRTIVPYGAAERRAGVMQKQAVAEAASPAAAADRLAYNRETETVVQGGGDLVDDLKAGRADLSKVDKKDLPPDMRELSAEKQREFVNNQAEQRGRLQTRIAELLKQRQAHIDAETRKLAEAGKGNGFDVQVGQIIREQAQRKGIVYADTPGTQPAGR